MKGLGQPAKAAPNNPAGAWEVRDISDAKHVYVEFRAEKLKAGHEDSRFLWYWKEEEREVDHSRLDASKYLKACFEIIRDNCKSHYMILSRTNSIGFVELEEFSTKLKHCFSPAQLKEMGDYSRKVQVLTAHRSKGLQADTVIVVDVCQGTFPLFHPDQQLSEMFGPTVDKVLAEERRLFYVAMTRAKENLFLLTDSGNKSDFLQEIESPSSIQTVTSGRLESSRGQGLRGEGDDLPF